MSFKNALLSTAAISSVCGLGLATEARAQAVGEAVTKPKDDVGLGEIVVTAQKREQSLQKVPLSIVALGSGSLDQRNITAASDLISAVPGLQFNSGTGSSSPFLRGIGNPSTAVGNESSVAMYTDGVYHTRLPIGFFTLNNIERVEVLKGPQGTLFGRNSTGGVIQIITKTPTQQAELQGSLGYGNFNTVRGDLYAAGAISDRLAADISLGGQYQKDGWGHNADGSRHGYQDNFTARTKWVLDASDTTKVTFIGYYVYAKSDNQGGTFPGFTSGYVSEPYARLSSTGFYDCNCDTNSYAKSNSWGTSLTIDQELPFASIKSISAYQRNNMADLFESDYTERPDFFAPTKSYVEQITQELQLSSLKGAPLEWILGLYYYDTTSEYTQQEWRNPTDFGPLGFDSFAKVHTRSFSAFGQATYELVENLKVTGGIRYTHDDVRGNGRIEIATDPISYLMPETFAEVKVNKVTYKGSLDYQFSHDVMAFASISRGYKSPTFNMFLFNPVPNKPEVLDAYEVGVKSSLLGGRLRLNLSGFWYDINAPQVQTFGGGSIILANAERARSKGAEVEVEAKLATGLTARALLTYMDSKYTKFTDAPSGPPNPLPPYGAVAPLLSINASGNRTPLAPEWTVNVGFDYKVDTSIGGFAVSADYYYNDGYFFEPDNLLHQGSHSLVNAQLKYNPTENFAVRVWGKNLNDAKYVVGASSQGGAPGYPFYPGAPRTFGMAFDFSF